MYAYIEERVMNVAEYIVEHEATVRAAASKFGISKSTVHHDMQVRLKGIDADMAERVRAILDKNKSERHIRGGMATYIKYKGKTPAKKKKQAYNTITIAKAAGIKYTVAHGRKIY